MSDIVLSAHQPNFMPYLGFFDKMQKSDIFVIRDEVLFVEKEFHNRNRIRINGADNLNHPQSKWIGVPVCSAQDYIMHIKIKKEASYKGKSWKDQLLHELEVNYTKAPYFSTYYPFLRHIILTSDSSLILLNLRIIDFLRQAFGIKTEVVLASHLKLKTEHYSKSDASGDLAGICQALGANIYLSGHGGKGYLNLTPFERENIEVRFQEYDHPVYDQVYPGFLPNMSALDALFCVGKMPEAGMKLVENVSH